MRPLCLLLVLCLLSPSRAANEEASARALVQQGNADAAAGLTVLALADWAKAATLAPALPDVYDARAAFRAARKEWEQALPDAVRAVQLSPNRARYEAEGGVLTRLARHAEAARSYSTALSLTVGDSKTAADYLADGVQYEAQGLSEKAQARYQQAARLDPQNADALRRSFALWRAWGEGPEALKTANALVALNLQDPQGYVDRADVLATMGHWAEAVADASQAISLSPRDPSVWLGRGVTLSEQAQTLTGNDARAVRQKAIDDFSRAILLDPNNVNAAAARGIAFYAQDDYDHALPDLNRAIDLGAGFAVAFLFRANIHALRHEDAQALDDFNKALQLDPSDARAAAGRADTLKRMGRRP